MIDKELEKANTSHPADTNGDGKVSKEEHDMFYKLIKIYLFYIIFYVFLNNVFFE